MQGSALSPAPPPDPFSAPQSSLASDPFAQQTFSADDFLRDHLAAHEALDDAEQRRALEKLSEDLKRRQAANHEALLDLLNNNYEDFISLSSELVGTNDSVNEIQKVVTRLRTPVSDVQRRVQVTVSAVQRKFQDKERANSKRKLLRTVVEISEAVASLQRDIGEAESCRHAHAGGESAGDGETGEVDDPTTRYFKQLDTFRCWKGNARRSSPSRSLILIERSCRLLTRVAILTPFVAKFGVVKDFQAASKSLRERVVALLKSALLDSLREKNVGAFESCLRSASFLGEPALVSETIGAELVAPIVSKHITSTLIRDSNNQLLRRRPSLAAKSAPSGESTDSKSPVSSSSSNSSSTALGRAFDSVVSGIREECSVLLQACESGKFESLLQIVIDSIWKEVLGRLIAQLFLFCWEFHHGKKVVLSPLSALHQDTGVKEEGSKHFFAQSVFLIFHSGLKDRALFSARFPNVFHGNFSASTQLLQSLESLFPPKMLPEFRKSPIYAKFKSQWRLTTYYLLRFQEIASDLEEALQQLPTADISSSSHSSGLHLGASRRLWKCLQKPWSDSVWLSELTGKFLNLTFELIQRYQRWVESFLEGREGSDKKARAHSGDGGGGEDEACSEMLTAALCLRADLKSLSSSIREHLCELVSTRISSQSSKPTPSPLLSALSASFARLCDNLEPLEPRCFAYVERELVDECTAHLQAVSRVKDAYWMISGTRVPSEPSPHVSRILQPLHNTLDSSSSSSSYLTTDDSRALTLAVLRSSSEKFRDEIVSLRQYLRKTEMSLTRIKRTTAAATRARDDSEKIDSQLRIDVRAYASEVRKLCATPESDVPSFQALLELVAEN